MTPADHTAGSPTGELNSTEGTARGTAGARMAGYKKTRTFLHSEMSRSETQ